MRIVLVTPIDTRRRSVGYVIVMKNTQILMK